MLKPPWGLNTQLTRPSDQDSGADLQADVMRFMAIIAFCLLAVFTLVQSAPMATQDTSTKQARTAEPTQTDVTPSMSNSTREATRSSAAKPTQEGQETKVTRLAHLQKKDAQAMQHRERKPPGPRGSVVVKNQPPNEQLEAPPRHQRFPNRTTSSTDTHAPTASISQAYTPVSKQPTRDAQGFALRFESDSALESLVAKGQVHLFGRVGKRIWRLSIEGNQLRFHPTTAPQKFHAMTPESVPERMLTALRRDASLGRVDPITWGVTLPPATTNQIMRHLRESSGGSLSIQADGQVRLLDAS